MIPEEIILPLLAALGMVLLAGHSPARALTVYLFAVIASVAAGAVWMRRSLPREYFASRPIYKTKEWMSIALPMMLGGLSQISMNRADMLILGSVLDMSDVGKFAAANRFALLITFALTAVNTIAAPMLAEAFHSEHHATDFQVVFRRASLWSALGGLPLLLVILVWPEALLRLFGAQFADASMLLRILAIGQFVNAATGPVGFVLVVSGRERGFAHSLAAVSGAMLLADLVLIPRFGVVAAAIIASLGVVALNLWQFLLARRCWRW
jgi:O-antigen/teichoic acid export membrane protein